eukprot:COSAG02_NODE_3791_length_6225_cov_13.023996_3_plen_992_part_00
MVVDRRCFSGVGWSGRKRGERAAELCCGVGPREGGVMETRGEERQPLEGSVEEEGRRRRGAARPQYRAIFAVFSCTLLIVFAGTQGAEQESSRRRAAVTDRNASCDTYLADVLREDECSIPPNPGTDEFRDTFGADCDPDKNWNGQTFQCMYVDRKSRLMDDPKFPDDVQLESAASATFIGGDGVPYGEVRFRQKKVPGCGAGGLDAPDPNTGLCEDKTSTLDPSRTQCIQDHKDHCDRESQFSVWFNDTDSSGKKLSITRWAVYDHSVPKGGACPGVGGANDKKCQTCGVETGVDPTKLKLPEKTQLYPDGFVDLYRLPFSTVVDEFDVIASSSCTVETGLETKTDAFGCRTPSKPEDPRKPLKFCKVTKKTSSQTNTAGEEICWNPYVSQQFKSKIDLPIAADATYADGGFIDSLVKHTIVVWGYREGDNETVAPHILGCAQIRPVSREGSCFLATHVASSYFRSYYCSYGGSWVTLIPFAMWLSYMFLVLGTTADNFFCPALASLSDMIGLSPRVAGVTLLALGNGAPDVFSIYASTKAGEYGIAVGEVTGAANFVCTGVIGICCIIHVNNGHDGLKARGMFLRDVFMLVVSTSYLLFILIDAHVTRTECTVFVSLYVVYVAMVIYGAKVPPLLAEDRPRWDNNQREMKRQAEIKKLTNANGGEPPTDAQLQELQDRGLSAPLMESENGNGPEEMEMEDPSGHGHGAPEPVLVPADADLFTKVLASLNWHNKSKDDQFFCIIQLPVTLIRRLTIPVVLTDPGEPTWNSGFNRLIMLLNPPFTGAFLVRFYEDFTATYFYPFGDLWVGQGALVGFIVCLPLCYPVWLMTSGPLPSKALVDVYVIFSFISALFWINVVADELVALLATLGDILRVNHAILGLTVLGCGNSMADLAADMSVTRAGFPNMAVTAAYAGPFFNMCIGYDYLLAFDMSLVAQRYRPATPAPTLVWLSAEVDCLPSVSVPRTAVGFVSVLQNWTVILDKGNNCGC